MCFPSMAGNITTSQSGNITTFRLTGNAPQGSEGPTFENRPHCLNVAFFMPNERFDGGYVWSFTSATCATTTTLYAASGTATKPCNSAPGVQLRPRKPGLDTTVNVTKTYKPSDSYGPEFVIGEDTGLRWSSGQINPGRRYKEKPYTTCQATGTWYANGNYDITLTVTDLNPKLTKIGIAKSRWQYQWNSHPAGWDGHFLGDYVEYSCINHNGVLQHDAWNHWWHCSSCLLNYGTAPHSSNTWRYDVNNLLGHELYLL